MRGIAVLLRLTPEEAALARKLAKDWKEHQISSGGPGRPAVLSAYLMELVREADRARRRRETQRKLPVAPVDQAVREVLAHELARDEKREVRSVDWALDEARNVTADQGWGAGPRGVQRRLGVICRWARQDLMYVWQRPARSSPWRRSSPYGVNPPNVHMFGWSIGSVEALGFPREFELRITGE